MTAGLSRGGDGSPKIPGPVYSVERAVEVGDTAKRYDDRLPAVAASPFVLGLAEMACLAGVRALMGDDYVTVGVRSRFEHLRATPVGVKLSAHARVVRRVARRWYFRVSVLDEGGDVVATVSHLRVAVKTAVQVTG